MSLESKIRLISIGIAAILTALLMQKIVIPAQKSACKKIYIEACTRDMDQKICELRLVEGTACN